MYLDVSGSMDAVKGPLYAAVLDCEALVERTVHLFSTRVADVSLAELRRGVCKTTGGTDIGCVAAHMAAHRVRRGSASPPSPTTAPRFLYEHRHEQPSACPREFGAVFHQSLGPLPRLSCQKATTTSLPARS